MINQITKTTRIVLRNKTYFSQLSKLKDNTPARREYLQFSKSRLVDFGELPFGQIPESLKYSRPTTLTKLSNGVRIATETYPGHSSAITVTVKAGTRQEELSNSSVSQFISRLALKGTSSLSKAQIEQKLDSFGGHIHVSVTRELTQFTLSFDKDQQADAVSFMGQIVLKPVFDPAQVQAEKVSLYKDATSISNPQRIAYDNAHYGAYRDHYMGQPSLGIRDNIYSITAQQIKEFHQKYYVGENIVVSGAGDIDVARFQDSVAKVFGNVSAEVVGEVPNRQKPQFTPSLMFQRDDQIPNTTTAVGFIAPSFNDPDFFAMTYFKRIIGSYRCDKYTGAHLNAAHLQYNLMHSHLGNYPDIIIQKPFYFAYSDTGLFGNFMFGNEVFNRQLLLLSQYILSGYAAYINTVEVFRARNKYWNDLLQRNNPNYVAWANSVQTAYLDRIISRTQTATRISHMNPEYLTRVATKWFWDKQLVVTAWGPLHHVMYMSHYNRPYKRSTLGEYSAFTVVQGY